MDSESAFSGGVSSWERKCKYEAVLEVDDRVTELFMLDVHAGKYNLRSFHSPEIFDKTATKSEKEDFWLAFSSSSSAF